MHVEVMIWLVTQYSVLKFILLKLAYRWVTTQIIKKTNFSSTDT